jgi:guanosine-3',5'-bis(diphosphate) 3'-pyrophosphohydrolase
MSELILRAIKYATSKHRGQKRKVSGVDYIAHPILVSYLAASYKQSKAKEILICAAILHDTVEDTDATYNQILRRFGMPIASIVFELSSDPVALKKVGKLEYLKSHMQGMSSYALFLKLCDRLANLMDNPSLKQVEDTPLIIKHLRATRKLTKSHKAVIAEINKILAEKNQ